MVIDKLENFGKYKNLIRNSDEIAAFLEKKPEIKGPVTAGGYELIPFSYQPEAASAKRWETHRYNVDIHIPLKGVEYLEWIRREELHSSVEVIDDPDAEFFDDEVKGMELFIKPGYFALLLPEDAHKPGILTEHATDGIRTGFKSDSAYYQN